MYIKHTKCGHVTENIIIAQLDGLLESYNVTKVTISTFYNLLMITSASCNAIGYPVYL